MLFGAVSTGAQDDLPHATNLVRHMLTRYGMSDALGLATFEAPRYARFLQVPTGAPREYSEDTIRVIDVEIQTLLEAAHTRGRATVTAQRGLLEALGQLLLVQEVVDRTTLLRLLGTAGFEARSETLGSPDSEAETGRVVEAQVPAPYTGGHTSTRAARQ